MDSLQLRAMQGPVWKPIRTLSDQPLLLILALHSHERTALQ